jgi:hypothetical protein
MSNQKENINPYVIYSNYTDAVTEYVIDNEPEIFLLSITRSDEGDIDLIAIPTKLQLFDNSYSLHAFVIKAVGHYYSVILDKSFSWQQYQNTGVMM